MLLGVYIYMANLENCLTISTHFKHTQTLTHSNPTPLFLLKKNKCLCSPRDRDEKAFSSFTSNSPKLENTQCPSMVEWTNTL